MRVAFIIIGIILYMSLPASVPAQAPQSSSPQSSTDTASQQGKGKKLNVDRFVAELDTDKDGCISHTEWIAPGLGEFHFQALSGQAEKNDCVTKRELLIGDPPDGIDLNGDGYLTVSEMIEFTKISSGGKGMDSGNSGQGGAPPGGSPNAIAPATGTSTDK